LIIFLRHPVAAVSGSPPLAGMNLVAPTGPSLARRNLPYGLVPIEPYSGRYFLGSAILPSMAAAILLAGDRRCTMPPFPILP